MILQITKHSLPNMELYVLGHFVIAEGQHIIFGKDCLVFGKEYVAPFQVYLS